MQNSVIKIKNTIFASKKNFNIDFYSKHQTLAIVCLKQWLKNRFVIMVNVSDSYQGQERNQTLL